jgi:endonuclease/exonuclease/phosphatase family metal-dependent hydrolase
LGKKCLPVEIKVVTYNIRSCEGMDGQVDLPRVALVLKSFDADIIALQEVEMGRPRTLLVKQANALARILDMGCVYGEAEKCKPGSFGNAILSKYPIKGYINHQLPAHNPQRALLEVYLDVDGQLIRFFNTHMELNRDLRLKQIREFIVPLIQSSDTPAVLAGDFNETIDDLGIKYLMHYFTDTFVANTGLLTNTFISSKPTERMDFIFLNDGFVPLDYRIQYADASDHLPVYAKILG